MSTTATNRGRPKDEPFPQESPFLTVRQAARLLNTTARQVYRLIHAGKLKASAHPVSPNKKVLLKEAIESILQDAVRRLKSSEN